MPVSNSLEEQWKASRHGAWAGRGFRFQDSAACWIALLVWSGDQPGSEIVPEGLDDLTIEGGTSWTHVLVKSRGDHRGGFPITQVVKWLKEGWRKQEARISAQGGIHLLGPATRCRTPGWLRSPGRILLAALTIPEPCRSSTIGSRRKRRVWRFCSGFGGGRASDVRNVLAARPG